jgi:hypothetical protein
MRERGMIFNADMVRAVLNGSKMQTRRILTPHQAHAGECHPLESGHQHANSQSYYREWCPFGLPGDRLWVRESFYEHGRWQGGGYDPEDSYFVSDKQVLYPADGIQRPAERKREDFWRSRPSIHMPRWASRITLEITGVRVERLASVSNEDARAEGYPADRAADGGNSDPWLWFRDLWDGIYPEQSFKVNPWVWVIEFKRVEV